MDSGFRWNDEHEWKRRFRAEGLRGYAQSSGGWTAS
jgi:hypothetical protein